MSSLFRLSSFVAAGVLAMAMSTPSAQAADFGINPTRVTLDAKKQVETITLTSNEDREVSFEVTLYKWTQDDKGQWVETPSSDLVVYPALMKMPARGKGIARVGAKNKEVRAQEGTYRLVLQELPGEVSETGGSMVRLLTRVSMPVFLAPAEPIVDLSLAAERSTAGARLTVINNGNVHLSPQNTKVEFVDATGNVIGEPIQAAQGAAYVLGGAKNGWTQEWGKVSCAQAVSVKITLESDKHTLEAPLSGSCK